REPGRIAYAAVLGAAAPASPAEARRAPEGALRNCIFGTAGLVLGAPRRRRERRLRARGDRQRFLGGLHLVHRRLHLDVEVLVRREAGAGRDEAAHDDVLLQAAQVVDAPGDGRLGEHLGGLLERRRGDERLRRERRLGDAEQQRLAGGRLSARRHHPLVLGVELALLHLLVDEEARVPHLADDRVLLGLARLEQLGHARQTAGDVLRLGGLARDAGDHLAGVHLIAVVDGDVGPDREVVARRLVVAGQHLRVALVILDDQ